MPTPADVLSAVLRSDPARPRLTFYDDTPGPAAGERIELSGRVLANWVSKAANALQDEWDLGPGSRVRLDLPPHWRAAYWALATWSVGACVVLPDGGDAADSDLLVTDDPAAARQFAGDAVLVTLAALARSSSEPAPPGVMDEARELSTYGDQLSAWATPGDDDPALVRDGGTTAYGVVVPDRGWEPGARVHTTSTDLGEVLLDALAAWAVDGSLVLSRGGSDVDRSGRLKSEGVTVLR